MGSNLVGCSTTDWGVVMLHMVGSLCLDDGVYGMVGDFAKSLSKRDL